MSMPRLSMTWPLVAALAVGCAAALAAPDVATDQLMLAGGGDRLWLVRTGADEASFDVLTYRAGEKWQWVKRGVAGKPAAIAAVGEQLHVLIGPAPAYVVVHADEGRGTDPRRSPQDIWPGEAAPLAACGAEDLAGLDGWSLVVVVPAVPPEPPQTGDESPIAAPTDRPVATDADRDETAPQLAISSRPVVEEPAGPAVLQFGDGTWRRLTDLPSAALADGSSVHVSAADNIIYLLVTSVSGDNSLWAWSPPNDADIDAKWTQIYLTGHAASATVLAMFHSGPDELTLVLALPGEQEQAERLEIVSLDSSGAATAPQPITLNDEPLTLPARPLAAPLVVSVPDVRHRVALLWRDDGSAKFTLCDVSTGVAEPARDVSALTEAPLDDSGRAVLNYFVIVLLVVTFAVMIAARPRTTPGPMILPPACRPAPLGKRVLAGMIDLMPISVIVWLVIIGEAPSEPSGGLRELWDQYNQVLQTRQAAYFWVVTLCTYMVYGVVMEARFGATLGKMLLKMRVVAGDGRPPGLREAALRNVVKMLEISMPWLLVIVPLLNPARQRLGDILARTVVIEYTPSTGGPGGGPPPPTDDEPFGSREDDDPGGP